MSKSKKQRNRKPQRQAKIEARKGLLYYQSLLVASDNPILQQTCSPITVTSLVDDQQQVAEVSHLLRCVLQACQTGVGLAAPQIGHAVRIILIQPSRFRPSWIMVNPVITSQSNISNIGIEGCLSYPGKTVEVKRPSWIEVDYLTETGESKHSKYEDWEARIVCHEIDHLNGVCQVKDLPQYQPDLPKPNPTGGFTHYKPHHLASAALLAAVAFSLPTRY